MILLISLTTFNVRFTDICMYVYKRLTLSTSGSPQSVKFGGTTNIPLPHCPLKTQSERSLQYPQLKSEPTERQLEHPIPSLLQS